MPIRHRLGLVHADRIPDHGELTREERKLEDSVEFDIRTGEPGRSYLVDLWLHSGAEYGDLKVLRFVASDGRLLSQA